MVAGGDRRHAWRLVPPGLVAVLLVAAVLSWQLDLGHRWLGWDYPSPIEQPAEVSPPPGLELAPLGAPKVLAEDLPDHLADPAKIEAALASYVADHRLGRHVRVLVQQLSDGSTLFEHGSGPVTPASTTKLLTTTAALAAFGPEHRFRTGVRTQVGSRTITLVGGGDPYLASKPVPAGTYPQRADLLTLATATAAALEGQGRSRVRLAYDAHRFGDPAVNPAWPKSYIPDNVVAPITALWVDEGRPDSGYGRVDDPALFAAQTFAKALRKQGIRVLGSPREANAPSASVEVASVDSAPLGQIVQRILDVSDNEGAEVLAHHVGLAERTGGTFAGGAAGVRKVLTSLGVDLTGDVFFDGSGLSRENRIEPGTLAAVLRLAASDEHPELRQLLTGLPVAGFTGSLAARFATGSRYGPGAVRAKTGTLTGVHGLAGLVTDRDGDELVFVALADRVKVRNTLAARATIDELAAALAGCRCGATP